MDAELREALRVLLRVWHQWGYDVHEPADGHVRIAHQCMTAGEEAVDLLQKYGLAEDSGHYAILTDAGKALLEDEGPE